MKMRFFTLILALVLMLIACNLPSTIVDNAIARTETARPAPTVTRIPSQTPTDTPAPTDTPVPTNTAEPSQTPTSPPEPTEAPQTLTLSLAQIIIPVQELNVIGDLFLPEVETTYYAGSDSCEIECLAQRFKFRQAPYRLEVSLAILDSRESALATMGNIAAALASSGMTSLPVSEEVTLGPDPSSALSLDSNAMPNNLIIYEVEPAYYVSAASIGQILIEMFLESLDGSLIDPHKAGEYLSYAMALQSLDVLAAYP
jgi:hypothetical protein